MLFLHIPPVIPKRRSWGGSLAAAVGNCRFIAQICTGDYASTSSYPRVYSLHTQVVLVMGLQRETASHVTLELYVQVHHPSRRRLTIYRFSLL